MTFFRASEDFSLGLERTGGFETVAFCEIEPYCRAVLAKHWPGVKQYNDVRTAEFPAADIVAGGFPCQDISSSGSRAGISGERSGLFRELVRAVRMVRPRYAILENVADLIHRGLGDVLGELAESGLRVEWDCISAQDVGAPHIRDRIWIVAYPDESGRPVQRLVTCTGKSTGYGHYAVERELQPGWCFRHVWRRPFHGGSNFMGWRQDWRDRLSTLCRMDDGISRRLDDVKHCGNALVPDIPELIGRAILEAESLTP